MKTPLELAEGLQNSNEKSVAFLAECYIKLYNQHRKLEELTGKQIIEIMELEQRIYYYEPNFEKGDYDEVD